MKKFLIAAATVMALSTGAFADQNVENANKMAEMRMEFFKMTSQMIDDEMMVSEGQMKRLSAYQRLLKLMMDNENSRNNK
jgi:hypothetical protein